MKHSIKKKYAGIFIGLMTATIVMCWAMNNFFLEKYYLHNKEKVLCAAYSQINQASNEGSIASDTFNVELQKVCEKYNINVLVVDGDSLTVMSTAYDSKILAKTLMNNLFGFSKVDEEDILLTNDNYQIQINMDQNMQTEFLEMWGFLDNGNPFILRIAVESIRDSVKLANQFLAITGIIFIIASGIIIWYTSRKITEPILELAAISEKMTHLDFQAKYVGKEKNEIGLLGKNINLLSNGLERTISELKTANNELELDLKKKTEIDEMRKEFLSNVSHELKTPIALIQGYAEGLRDGINEDAEGREFYCEVIVDEANKMNELVKKLLTLNQLEFGNDTITMERFDITEMISNYLTSAVLLAKQNGITVQMESYEPIYVWADEFKVEEVLTNYFSNAVNHCINEKIIDIKLVKKENTVRVSVFDSGLQVPEEEIPHIWEKFYKVDKARSREYGGSGVGLSIVKAIMDSMNQGYGVENYENGVSFWFELEMAETKLPKE